MTSKLSDLAEARPDYAFACPRRKSLRILGRCRALLVLQYSQRLLTFEHASTAQLHGKRIGGTIASKLVIPLRTPESLSSMGSLKRTRRINFALSVHCILHVWKGIPSMQEAPLVLPRPTSAIIVHTRTPAGAEKASKWPNVW